MTEREVRFILLLKMFQSLAERAPIVEEEARSRERTCHERESPLVEPRVTAACIIPDPLVSPDIVETRFASAVRSEASAYDDAPHEGADI